MKNTAHKGFTLLEMLVVIVLLSLMTTLISYAVSLGGQVFDRAQLMTEQYPQLFDSERWLRQTVSNTVPYSQENFHFVGTRSEISGITSTPIKHINQAPQRYSWQLLEQDGELLLRYREGYQAEYTTIRRLNNVESHFEFMDRSENLHEVWPISDASQTLPKRISLIIRNNEKKVLWEISPLAPKANANRGLEPDV